MGFIVANPGRRSELLVVVLLEGLINSLTQCVEKIQKFVGGWVYTATPRLKGGTGVAPSTQRTPRHDAAHGTTAARLDDLSTSSTLPGHSDCASLDDDSVSSVEALRSPRRCASMAESCAVAACW